MENHEKVLMEVENSHRVSINALKDHLKSENEQETKRLQEDFDKEKGISELKILYFTYTCLYCANLSDVFYMNECIQSSIVNNLHTRLF